MKMKKLVLGVLGILVILTVAACTTVSKKTTTVSPAVFRYEVASCMVFPFLSAEGTYAADRPRVMYNGAEKVSELVRRRLTEIFPYVIDRYATYKVIRDIEPFVEDNGENLVEVLNRYSDVDAVVVGKVYDYNPSRVGFFIKCLYLENEETLWTGEVEVKVSGASLDIEKAANLAVEKVIEDLEAKLGR